MRRFIGITFGIVTQAVFAVTVWFLFGFLRGEPCPAKTAPAACWIDILLGGQFAIWHSLLLLPRVRGALTRWIPPPFYGSFFCLMTCATLEVTIMGWQKSLPVVWQATGMWRTFVWVGFGGSWCLLFYSLYLTGLGYQTGLTPWWHWVNRRPAPRRIFQPRGAYRLLRHPVYLSFLGLIWFTPEVSLDRVVLMAVWTSYVFIGSVLKDRRMAFYLGDEYLTYAARVPGYPFLPIGPLARTAWTPPESDSGTQAIGA